MNQDDRPSRPMHRREFLRLGGVAAAAAFAGIAGVAAHWKWQGILNTAADVRRDLRWSRHAPLSMEQRIEQHFHYLRLDPAGVREYVADYLKHRGGISRFREPQDDVFQRFLLSTDFFPHGADESREVRYRFFYDPYVSPCWNPFRPADLA